MTVCLPEGAELATNSRGRYVYTLSDRHTEDYSFTITKKENIGHFHLPTPCCKFGTIPNVNV